MVCRGVQYIILVGWSCDHVLLAVVGQSQSELLYSCEVDKEWRKQLKSGPAHSAK